MRWARSCHTSPKQVFVSLDNIFVLVGRLDRGRHFAEVEHSCPLWGILPCEKYHYTQLGNARSSIGVCLPLLPKRLHLYGHLWAIRYIYKPRSAVVYGDSRVSGNIGCASLTLLLQEEGKAIRPLLYGVPSFARSATPFLCTRPPSPPSSPPCPRGLATATQRVSIYCPDRVCISKQ